MNHSATALLVRCGVVSALLLFVGCGYSDQTPPRNENAGKVAVLITGWGEPQGWDYDYRLAIAGDARMGAATRYPGEACTEMHVGRWPFASQIGLLPHAVAYQLPLLGGAWDAMGIYRLSDDGSTYVSIVDSSIRLAVADLPADSGLLIPMIESPLFPERSLGGLDPRDGANYLEQVFQIGVPSRERGRNPLAMPNGISDVVELGLAASIVDMGFMYEDQTPRANAVDERMTARTIGALQDLFGDKLVARFGAYAATPQVHPNQQQVALDLVEEGFTRLILTRETTDNNQYANTFMTRGWIDKALCKAGYRDDVEIKQTRQVGRTPEYNTALLEVLRAQLERRPTGTETTVIYTTYGMPFPGASDSGPFAVAHPLAAEEYHENAYLNYQAFIPYARSEFGADYPLVFARAGTDGALRTDAYFAYAMFPSSYYGAADDPLRFPTIRENIEQAKAEGRRDVVILLSHWSYNNTDNMLAMRKLNQIPYSSREDVRQWKYWVEWCELAGAPEPVDCGLEGAVRLGFSEVFDKQSDAFAAAYAHRIRGTVERYGLLPTSVTPLVTGPVSAADGGVLEVSSGPLAGARLAVPADPQPGLPESNRWDDYQVFVDPARPFIGAWFDFEAYIAQVGPEPEGAVSAAAMIGPYRTIVNQPARITLPLLRELSDVSQVQPVIYNEFTENWDPVYPVAGGQGLSFDAQTGTVSFDVQVFGTFALIANSD